MVASFTQMLISPGFSLLLLIYILASKFAIQEVKCCDLSQFFEGIMHIPDKTMKNCNYTSLRFKGEKNNKEHTNRCSVTGASLVPFLFKYMELMNINDFIENSSIVDCFGTLFIPPSMKVFESNDPIRHSHSIRFVMFTVETRTLSFEEPIFVQFIVSGHAFPVLGKIFHFSLGWWGTLNNLYCF